MASERQVTCLLKHAGYEATSAFVTHTTHENNKRAATFRVNTAVFYFTAARLTFFGRVVEILLLPLLLL